MSEIKGYECKHVQYAVADPTSPGDIPDDLIAVKENIHYEDGTIVPHLRCVKNFQRPFWVTKPAFRNHEEKREYEYIDHLDRFDTTQAGLASSIKKALNYYAPHTNLIALMRSPYVYGADISVTTIAKRKYMDKYPDLWSDFTFAVLDLETDMLEGHGMPIFGGLTFKNRAVLAVVEEYTRGFEDFSSAMKEHFHNRLSDLAGERGLDPEIVICQNPLELVRALFQRAHEWMPDFIAIWNMDFDIPKILTTIEHYGGDPGEILADPKVPERFRKVWYKQGASHKVTANGRYLPMKWVDRWHVLHTPASFYVIDQACVFRRLRIAKGNEPSYALDYILGKYAGIGKLKNERADHLHGAAWHRYMQRYEPLEYGVYNLYDCISCEILDEQPKVGDLRQSLPVQIGHSDFASVANQPRRAVDDLFFLWLEHGLVIGTSAGRHRREFDNYTVDPDEWIVTLDAHMVEDNGLEIIDEIPRHRSKVRVGVYDLDVTSAYPTGEDVLNCSITTTIAEPIGAEGVDELTKRQAGLNLTAGTTNATVICHEMLGAPDFETLLDDYERNEEGDIGQ